MTPRWPEPPASSVWLLKRVLPSDVRATVLRDLDEVFQVKAADDGASAARRWYKKEARSFARQFMRERTMNRLRSIRFSTLDAKLAGRMIVKYPGITVVGGLAIATAIAITTIAFEITHDFSDPSLPLPNADRIVSLQLWDGASNQPETRLTYELAQWRGAASLDSVGGYVTVERNLIVASGDGEVVRVAQMSPAGFRVAGVAPLLGRVLNDADSAPDAPRVVVIGYDVWTTRFNADPHVIGRAIQLGADAHVVVGVMPEAFAFPVSHSLWIPLPAATSALPRFGGPGIRAFGKLKPSASMATAMSELAAISARQPVDVERKAPLQPRVVPYAAGLIDTALLKQAYVLQSVLVMVLIICCANVATLVFARTATRQPEITVRTALGASRARILALFFVEALALAAIGAGVGVLAANAAIQWTMRLIWSTGFPKPFWWDDRIAPVTYIYAAALTLLVAAICGIVPALKGTRQGVSAGLQENAGRGSSVTFGAGWTAIIVLQVALCVALLPFALWQAWDATRALGGGINFAASEYLATTVEFDSNETDAPARRVTAFRDLSARLMQEHDVTGVAFADRFPGMADARGAVEVDDVTLPDRELPSSYTSIVAPGFFQALDVRATAGRVFNDADVAAKHSLVVVNHLFVKNVLGGRNPIGRRVRFVSRREPMPWFAIIGVVPDLGMSPLHPEDGAGLYRVAAPGEDGVNSIAIHVQTGASTFAPRLRAIALAVNPSLRLKTPMTLDVVGRADQLGFRFFAFALFATAAIGVVLATTGIYAMMSFTVSRRTREIAIRAALGANPARIVGAIFSRAALQIGGGALAGVALVLFARPKSAREVWLPMALALFMLVVGVFACALPAKRALQIEPSDALKET